MKKKYLLEWAEEAQQDLINIGLFISNDNIERALSFMEELREVGNNLAIMPNKGVTRIYPRNRQVKVLIHKEYKIVYRLKDNKIIIEQIHKENEER